MDCLSSVPNDKGCMHARVALSGNPSRCLNSPLFAIALRNMHKAPEGWNYTLGTHGKAADQLMALETTYRPPFVGEPQKGGRPARKAGRPTSFCLLFLVFCNTKQKRGIARYFKQNVCMTTLPIIAQAPGSVVLDPRAINHASWCMMAEKSDCTTQCEMNAHINTYMPKLHHVLVKSVGDRESRHVSSLGVSNVPRFPCSD